MLTKAQVIDQFFPKLKDSNYIYQILWVPPFRMFAVAADGGIKLQNQQTISCRDMQECLDLGLKDLDAAAHVAAKKVLGPGEAKILKSEAIDE